MRRAIRLTAANSAPGNGRPPERLRVLLVATSLENAPSMRECLLQSCDIEADIMVASGLPETLALLASDKCNIAILDLTAASAGDALDDLATLARTAPDLPIIALGATYSSHLAAEALRVGAEDFLPLDELDSRRLGRTILHATERKKAESDLRISEARFRALYEQSPNPVCIHRPDGLSIGVNQAILDRFQMTREQADRYNVLQDEQLLVQPEAMQAIRRAFSGEATNVPLIRFSSDEHGWANEELTRWIKGVAYPIKDDAGDVREVVLLWEDVTEQERAEDAVREREEEYRAIFEATTDGLVINDWAANVVQVNPAFAAMHGYTVEEMIGMPPPNFIHPDSHALLQQFFETVKSGEQFYCQAMDVRKDGTAFPVEVHGALFNYRGEPHILGVVRDITERVQARELLEQRVEERTRELATLLEVSSNVASTLELEPLLGRILEQLKLVTDYGQAAVMVLEGDVLSVVESRLASGEPSPATGWRFTTDRLGDAWQTLTSGEPVIVHDVRGNDTYARTYRDVLAEIMHITSSDVSALLETHLSYVRSWMGVPLMLKENVIGLLTLAHGEPGYYEPRHAKLAMAIANQAAIAIENARLYEQAQETTRKTAALAQVASQVAFGGSLQSTLGALCRHIVGVSGALASAVMLRDPDTGISHMVGADGLPEGYMDTINEMLAQGFRFRTEEAIHQQRPVLMENMRETLLGSPACAPLHSFMHTVLWDTIVAVPMIYHDTTVGILLSYYPAARKISEAEMAFHTVMADQAAVAVENARLLAQAHDKTRLEERQRLARELHDSVTQALFSTNLIARSLEVMLQREGTHSPAIMERMADLRQLTHGALAEMRALIFELRPGALEEEGLLEALRKHAAGIQGREGLQVEVTTGRDGALPRLKPAAEEALYRIAQEALHNVVKHARATRVQVSIGAENGAVTLQVADNGVGFDVREVPAGHMGLGTMGQRAQALHAEYVVDTCPGGGTRVTVRVPLDEWQLTT